MAFNVRVNKESLKNVEDNVRTVIDRVFANKQMLELIGQTIIDDVKFQTRRGRSIPTGGGAFDQLSPKWIAEREKIAAVQKVADVFKSTRSNLTITGELLDSMDVVKVQKGSLTIDFVGTHSVYKAQSSRGNGVKTIPSNPSNQVKNKDLARYVAENGRPFLGVRLALKARLNRIVVGFIRRAGKVYKLTR
jgi:hypothetical protein